MQFAEVSTQTQNKHRIRDDEREKIRAANRALMVRLMHAFAAFGLLATLLLAFWLEPDPRGLGTHEQIFLLPCNFYAMTGLPCPFCGTTTAFAHMAHGHVRDAFLAQPMGVIGFVMCVLFLPISIGAAISGRNLIDAIGRLPWGNLSWLLGGIILASWLFKLIMVILY